jgi:hypothetical protein
LPISNDRGNIDISNNIKVSLSATSGTCYTATNIVLGTNNANVGTCL